MKLGMGLYRNMFTANEVRFAKQAGATHIVAHMPAPTSPVGEQVMAKYGKAAGHGYGAAGDPIWTYEGLRDLKALVNSEGLELAALESFAPGDWYDILLDGPRKAEQYERLKLIIRDMGRVGIPVMGYYFSVAGVWGHQYTPEARGGAVSAGYNQANAPETPIPAGMVWNMVYDAEQFNPADPTHVLPPVSDQEIQQRFSEWLNIMVPVAEEAGVKLALHPDDPPMPVFRGQHRLSYTLERYKHILDLNPSPANTLEMCVGTMAEMAGGTAEDLYATVDAVSAMGRVGYVHFRNVRGKVPHYFETFVDEGDTDMIKLLTILDRNGFDGVLIPDHTPQMQCAAPWHAGMAFAMGYIKAAITMIQRNRTAYMRIVVTGARGMLGAATVTYLRELGINVLAVDAIPATSVEPGVEYLRVDLREAGEVYDVLDGADAVLHLAAIASQRIYTSGHTFFNNVGMTWNILEAAARLKIPRVVVASSLQVNHTVTPRTPIKYEYFPVDEDHPVSPQDDYGLSKYVGEICADTFATHWGLTVASIRFPLIANADNFAKMPLDDMEVPFGALFAYVALRDAARMCHLAATAPLPPRSHTVFMAAARDSSLGHPTRDYLARHFPEAVVRPGLAEYGSTIDSSRAERLLGWVPEISVKR